MNLIDQDGKIFGLINILDAFALLIAIIVVIGGIGFVTGNVADSSGPTTLPSTYVTLDLGTQSGPLVQTIEINDSYSPAVNSHIRISDVHLSPQDGQTRVLVRVEIQGPATGDSVSYEGAPPRIGRSLSIVTKEYSVSGKIVNQGSSDKLRTTDTEVLLRATFSESNISTMSDQKIRIGAQTVAVLHETRTYLLKGETARLSYIHATLHTYRSTDGPRFGNKVIHPGTKLVLPVGNNTLDSTILDTGSVGQFTTTEVVLEANVSDRTASVLTPGKTYQTEGQRVATIESVTEYGTKKPNQKRVFVGLSLSTLKSGGVSRFGNTEIREGESVFISGEESQFSGIIRRVGDTEQRGNQVRRSVSLQISDAPPETSSSIREGMVETAGGMTIAELTEVTRTNSTVVLTSQNGDIYLREHPTKSDITITADLLVRETSAGILFKGRPLRINDVIVLDLGMITVEATVTGT
jgi:sulfur carrier protein ThiS